MRGAPSAPREPPVCDRKPLASVPAGTPAATLADALVAVAEASLAACEPKARPAVRRHELVVMLREERLAEGGWHAELADGSAIPGAGDPAPVRWRRGRHGRAQRRRRHAARRRPQAAHAAARARPRAPPGRRRLPLPGMHASRLRRRASHPALGRRRRDEPRKSLSRLPSTPRRSARRRLPAQAHGHGRARLLHGRRFLHPAHINCVTVFVRSRPGRAR
jgi:hypothetical protein